MEKTHIGEKRPLWPFFISGKAHTVLLYGCFPSANIYTVLMYGFFPSADIG